MKDLKMINNKNKTLHTDSISALGRNPLCETDGFGGCYYYTTIDCDECKYGGGEEKPSSKMQPTKITLLIMKQKYTYKGHELTLHIKQEEESNGGDETPSTGAYDSLTGIVYKGVEISELINPDVITEIEQELNVEFDY